uniref:F-box domain-containing protein n=1 Tax=Meloidogyne hapla TaxID=6305 RepID=A0A1I8BDM7_MELHA
MKNLQDEVKLDVLQCLNFNQLFSVRQTYYYFNWLIGKYEGILACKEFWQLNLVSGWQNALDRNIPLYIGGKPGSTYSVQLLPTGKNSE